MPVGAPADVELLGAEQRHVAPAEVAGGLGGEHRVDVRRAGEPGADDVVVVEAVALDHGAEQLDDPLDDGVAGVVLDGGRAADGSDGAFVGRHGG